MPRWRFESLWLAFLFLLPSTPAPAVELDFAHDIVPILRTHCGRCHTGDKKQGGLSLNTRPGLLAGGESGPAVVVGKSEQSELLKRIVSRDETLRMPPEGPRVAPEQIALLRRWIDMGLPWEEGFAFRQQAYEPPLLPRRPDLPPAQDGRENPIDRLIDAYLAARSLPRPAPISDAAFARRVYLDLIGLLPTPVQLQQFLDDPRSHKRQALIHELLDSDLAYAEHWLTFWNDLLRNDYTGTGFITGGRKQITSWLHRALLENKPYDQFVRELISPTAESEGFIQGIRWRGDVSASQTNEIQFAQSISQSFLGINMKCASCHDSFVDRWKLDEAYGLAAIYATQPLAVHRCDKPTGATAKPAWVFPELGQVDPGASQPERLKQLAQLMTDPRNGRFTRTIVNRLWHRLMGRGIVHPVDAMHTEPWNADLLDYLATYLADQRYDLKATLELVCSSAAYQSSVAAADVADDGDYVFHGPLPKRLTAEQFVDAVWQLTGTAPARYDAPVLRAKLTPAANAARDDAGAELAGKWIWSSADAAQAKPAAGEAIAVRRQVNLSAVPRRAVAVITCDNEYILYVNAKRVAADANWETVETVALEPYLKQGANEFVIVGKNGGAGPNPAGLFFAARWVNVAGAEEGIATDANWELTNQLPDGNGRFRKEAETSWRPAVEITSPGVWEQRVGAALGSSLRQALHSPLAMVRASLVKSDYLMRTLGRPNRDQIVTMRPSELTTLEAIDLANGQILADLIHRGAESRVADARNDLNKVTDELFVHGLARQPTADERTTVRELTGTPPSVEGLADAIWTILMLPEFQLVR